MNDTSWLPLLLFPLAALAVAFFIVWWTWPKRPKSHDNPPQD